MKLLKTIRVDKNEKIKIKKARRAGDFAKYASKAALEVMENIEIDQEKTGVIVATMFGAHKTTFKFLDDLLDYSDGGVSPTTFSHSVHNVAASYVSSLLDIRGPCTTITCFDDPLAQALVTADAWLNAGMVDTVFVCYVEELSEPLSTVNKHCKLPSFSEEGLIAGAYGLLLERGEGFEYKNFSDLFKE